MAHRSPAHGDREAAAKPSTAEVRKPFSESGRPPRPGKGDISPRRSMSSGRPPREPDTAVVGMGEHVPAFMLRDVPIRKKA